MCPVDDHGLEVLKKSGEEVTPGDKSNYYIKLGGVNSKYISVPVANSFTTEVVSVGTSVTEIEPHDNQIWIRITPSSGQFYWGENNTPSTDSEKINNNNPLYLATNASVFLQKTIGSNVNVFIVRGIG